VYPGQQLTTADFATTGGALATTLAPRQRAITLPFDSTHGIINSLHAGDTVDVYAIFNVGVGGQSTPLLRLIMQKIQVVDIASNTDGQAARLTFRVRPQQAAELAFASDNGRLWLSLRPSDRAKPSPPSAVTVDSLMLGVPQVTVLKQLGARR
jgi:Flp pilus assembly protein CpaB